MAAQSSVSNNRFSIDGYSKASSSTLNPALLRSVPKAPITSSQDNGTALPEVVARSRNKILSALSADAWQRLAPHLRRVLLHQDDVLHEKGSEIKHIYFVENGMISLVVDANFDSQIEAAVIGSEGMVGVLSILGNYPSVHRALVQIPGKAYRLPVAALQNEWKRNSELQGWIFNYANLLMAQVSQTVLCSRVHSIEARLNRWLLAVRDRSGSDEMELTHDYIAQMLGVRRPGVTIALGMLQQSGLIECGRGRVTIINSEKMEHGACECYSTLRQQFQAFEHQMCAHSNVKALSTS